MPALPDWNAVRFNQLSNRGHVESYFLKANDAEGRRALWLKATIYASTARPAYAVAEAWAVVFDRGGQHVAVKQSIPFGDAQFSPDRLAVTVGEHLQLTEDTCRGNIVYGDHHVSWRLKFEGDAAPLVPFPLPRMYTGAFPKSKLVSPKPDLVFTGSINVDNQEIAVSSWRGMQGHNWGRGHADLYAWGHCNQWEQHEDVVLEAASARVRVGPVMTPMLTLVNFRHEGVHYNLSGPINLAFNRGHVFPRRWSFKAKSHLATVEADFSAQTPDFVGLYYPNPDGAMTYCLNSKLASGRVRIYVPGRRPLDLTTKSAALELGLRDANHGVDMYV